MIASTVESMSFSRNSLVLRSSVSRARWAVTSRNERIAASCSARTVDVETETVMGAPLGLVAGERDAVGLLAQDLEEPPTADALGEDPGDDPAEGNVARAEPTRRARARGAVEHGTAGLVAPLEREHRRRAHAGLLEL